MSDARLRTLERAARANTNDVEALVAFAKAYLRSTAPPAIPTLSPDMMLDDLTPELVAHNVEEIKTSFRNSEVVKTLYVMRTSVRVFDRQGNTITTLRDFVLSHEYPDAIDGVGRVRGDIIRLIVMAAGLKFSGESA